MTTKTMSWEEFSRLYCETQAQTAEGLLARLQGQRLTYNPEGWFMGEAQLMDSSYHGQRTILPYGGGATAKVVPTTPFTPRGQASDTSVVIGILPVNALPS